MHTNCSSKRGKILKNNWKTYAHSRTYQTDLCKLLEECVHYKTTKDMKTNVRYHHNLKLYNSK